MGSGGTGKGPSRSIAGVSGFGSTDRAEVTREHLLKAEAMFRETGIDYWLRKAQNALAKL